MVNVIMYLSSNLVIVAFRNNNILLLVKHIIAKQHGSSIIVTSVAKFIIAKDVIAKYYIIAIAKGRVGIAKQYTTIIGEVVGIGSIEPVEVRKWLLEQRRRVLLRRIDFILICFCVKRLAVFGVRWNGSYLGISIHPPFVQEGLLKRRRCVHNVVGGICSVTEDVVRPNLVLIHFICPHICIHGLAIYGVRWNSPHLNITLPLFGLERLLKHRRCISKVVGGIAEDIILLVLFVHVLRPLRVYGLGKNSATYLGASCNGR
mmetsp:Transcript_14402/g.26014  ORF Transcript_14402/g.26014 Transcript_14402/m.26014 type:complete len:260 (+) Transcript_14402:2039-2818(+)